MASTYMWVEMLRERLDTDMKVSAAMKEWREKLAFIQPLLLDAAMKRFLRPDVRTWVFKFRGLAKDIEGVIDAMADPDTSPVGKGKSIYKALKFNTSLVGKAMSIYKAYNPKTKAKIREVTKRIDLLMNESEDLGLQAPSAATTLAGREAFPATKEVIFGREKDKEAIIKLLLGDSSEPFSVIAIYGEEGVGKTTLAHMVYCDRIVQDSFDLRIWVSAARKSVLGLTRNIMGSIIPNRWDLVDLNGLQTKLQQTLHNRKFLIVLDGLDSYNSRDDLDRLYCPFGAGDCGSKLLVTTCHKTWFKSEQLYRLNYLSDNHLGPLFAHHALGDSDSYSDSDSDSDSSFMCREFVKKCRGCPLVAMVLGGLLRTNQDHNEWKTILHSELWQVGEVDHNEWKTILHSELWQVGEVACAGLMVGFQFLPSHLKLCLMYSSIFLEGYVFDKEELVRLWMAEGLLPSKDGLLGEDIGSIYFSDLLSRSFFQKSHTHENLFEMHGLISNMLKVYGDVFPGCNFERRHYDGSAKNISFATDIFHGHRNRHSRVLSLDYCMIREMSFTICQMKLLRYLSLSETQIKCLPEWVCDLINLQTLLLANCHSLVSLPQGIANLVNLCFLDISDTPKLQEMPPGIGCLGSLRKLCKFMVGDEKGLGIKELGNLSLLRGDLLISGLHNVVDEEDAKKANLKEKDGLDCIAMEWSSRFDGSRNGLLEREVMNSLQPHAKIEKLRVAYYGGPAFASWIGHPSFADMLSVELHDCFAVTSLPSLGKLPLLRDLSIRGLHFVRVVGDEFYGDGDGYGYPFPRLETLLFEDMLEWVEWLSPSGHANEGFFPCLRVLQIVNCPKLVGELPKGMMNRSKNKGVSPLKKLEISGCASLAEFPSGELSASALKQLIIRHCSSLECISKRMPHFSTSLEAIDFNGYTSLEFFPDFPQDSLLFPKLKELAIKNCGNLKSLPKHVNHLTSLRSLRISNCPRLSSLPEGDFWPPKLTSLAVLNCAKIHRPFSEWGLDKLSSLLVLAIEAVGPPDMAIFPDYYCILPPSITKLSIKQMQNLEYLGDGLLDLTSLKELLITNCPMLKYLPRDGLPPTLHAISIRGCPFLQHRCVRDKGEYWRFLAYIPDVETDQDCYG